MAKNSLNDWSATPAANTDIAGTNINVGCAPQDVGVFMRTCMAQIAACVQGTGTALATWYATLLSCTTLDATTLNVSGVATVGSLDITGLPPGVNYGDFKHSALGNESAGWRLCYGQTRPRTDPLWIYIVANSLTWVFGSGDGSTTYTMPDCRDVAFFGLGNMGGTDKGLITTAISGIAGTTLGATGGSQLAQQDNLSVTGGITASSTLNEGGGHIHGAPGGGAFLTTGGGPGGGGGNFVNTYYNTAAATTGATVSTTISNTLAITSGLTGTSQNMPPAMMMPVLMYCGA